MTKRQYNNNNQNTVYFSIWRNWDGERNAENKERFERELIILMKVKIISKRSVAWIAEDTNTNRYVCSDIYARTHNTSAMAWVEPLFSLTERIHCFLPLCLMDWYDYFFRSLSLSLQFMLTMRFVRVGWLCTNFDCFFLYKICSDVTSGVNGSRSEFNESNHIYEALVFAQLTQNVAYARVHRIRIECESTRKTNRCLRYFNPLREARIVTHFFFLILGIVYFLAFDECIAILAIKDDKIKRQIISVFRCRKLKNGIISVSTKYSRDTCFFLPTSHYLSLFFLWNLKSTSIQINQIKRMLRTNFIMLFRFSTFFFFCWTLIHVPTNMHVDPISEASKCRGSH